MATANWYGNSMLGQWGTTAARRIDWVTDTINCGLTTNTYSQNFDTHTFYSDITNEVTGTNYVAKGVVLSGKTLTYDSATDETRLDSNDPTFTNITVTGIRKAFFFKDTGAAGTSPLMFLFIFDGDQSVTAADFIIQLDATGAAKIDTT